MKGISRHLPYLVSLGAICVSQVGYASLPVCERSAPTVRMLEQVVQKSCDQITQEDLSRMDHFQIGFDNDLVEVKPQDSEGVTGARFLYLNCNPNLAAVPGDLAKGMDKLEVLAIHTNPKLHALPEELFTDLSERLDTVLMVHNGLTSLPESFFARFAKKSGVRFSLGGNPFTPETLARIQKAFGVELDQNGELPSFLY